jgi:hypothetical protein
MKHGLSTNGIGVYTPEERKRRIERFLEKRRNRVWTKRVKYDVRKVFKRNYMNTSHIYTNFVGY